MLGLHAKVPKHRDSNTTTITINGSMWFDNNVPTPWRSFSFFHYQNNLYKALEHVKPMPNPLYGHSYKNTLSPKLCLTPAHLFLQTSFPPLFSCTCTTYTYTYTFTYTWIGITGKVLRGILTINVYQGEHLGNPNHPNKSLPWWEFQANCLTPPSFEMTSYTVWIKLRSNNLTWTTC